MYSQTCESNFMLARNVLNFANKQSWIRIRSSHHVWFIQLLFLRKQGLNLWKNDESWYSSPKIDSIWDADRKLGWSDVKTWFSQEKDREKGDFFRQTLRIRRPWRFWTQAAVAQGIETSWWLGAGQGDFMVVVKGEKRVKKKGFCVARETYDHMEVS